MNFGDLGEMILFVRRHGEVYDNAWQRWPYHTDPMLAGENQNTIYNHDYIVGTCQGDINHSATRRNGSPDSVYPSNPKIPTRVNVVARLPRPIRP